MGCCPTTYWCTADGPVGVEADEDGVFTPPDGATAGPFASREEAAGGCPYAICDPNFEVPSGGLVLSVVDQSYSGPVSPTPPPVFPENSYPLADYTVGDDSITASSGYVPFNATGGAVINLSVGFTCREETACGSAQVMVEVRFTGFNGVGTTSALTPSSEGWTAIDGGAVSCGWYKCFDPATLTFPIDVGTVEFCTYVGSSPPTSVCTYSARLVIDD